MPKRLLITKELLERIDIGISDVEIFEDVFPKGTMLTKEAIKKANSYGLDELCLFETLLAKVERTQVMFNQAFVKAAKSINWKLGYYFENRENLLACVNKALYFAVVDNEEKIARAITTKTFKPKMITLPDQKKKAAPKKDAPVETPLPETPSGDVPTPTLPPAPEQ